VAGMEVNFDNGVISNGNLQVGVADQAWSVAFDGAISNGAVNLNAIGGQLIDVTGAISNQSMPTWLVCLPDREQMLLLVVSI